MNKNVESKRIMAIDPGSKRIGIAISDLSGTIARPLTVIEHRSRKSDAQEIIKSATENQVVMIVIGVSFDEEEIPTPSGRSAIRLANEIKEQSDLPITIWDEYHTTRDAIQIKITNGANRKSKKGHQDGIAAMILLQDFIEHYKRIGDIKNIENHWL